MPERDEDNEARWEDRARQRDEDRAELADRRQVRHDEHLIDPRYKPERQVP